MFQTTEYIITAGSRLGLCDELSQAVCDFCSGYIKDKRDILRYRLTVEECLLNWLTEDSIGKKLVFRYGKKLGSLFFELGFYSAPVNPYVADYTLGAFGESALRSLGLSPTYSYKNGQNILRFSIPKQEQSTLKKLATVLLSAVIIGAFGSLLLPAGIIQAAQNMFISPVYDAFFRILNCVAGPMIFLSVAWGVYGIGDTSTLSLVGKKMLLKFIGNDFVVGLCSVLLLPVFSLNLSGGGISISGVSELIDLLLSFIPDNLFSPFIEGNTMQIIFLAFAMGIALLFLGKLTESVAHAIEQINYIIRFFMDFIAKLVPFFVFLVIVSLFWSGSLGILRSTWKMLLTMLVGIFVTILGFYIFTSLRQRVSLLMLLKKCFPSFLIALTTASSAATFSTNRDVVEKKLGVKESVSSFGIPLGMVINNPIAVLNNIVVVFFFAHSCGVECSLNWLVTAIILSVVLAVATPPIPGGGAVAYALLFTQLGIPADALPIVLAIDMISDFIITAGEMSILPISLLNVSSSISMVDREILEKD